MGPTQHPHVINQVHLLLKQVAVHRISKGVGVVLVRDVDGNRSDLQRLFLVSQKTLRTRHFLVFESPDLLCEILDEAP